MVLAIITLISKVGWCLFPILDCKLLESKSVISDSQSLTQQVLIYSAQRVSVHLSRGYCALNCALNKKCHFSQTGEISVICKTRVFLLLYSYIHFCP